MLRSRYRRIGHPSILLFGLVIALIAPLVSAEEADGRDWDVALGMGVGVFPKYQGAKNSVVVPFPKINLTWKDLIFVGSASGSASLFGGALVNAGVFAFNTDPFQAGLAVGYEAGRNAPNSGQLRNIGDVDDAVLVELFARYTLGLLEISTSAARSLGGSDGTRVGVGLSTVAQLSEELFAYASLSTMWADKRYMRSHFGISNRQSLRSGLERFTLGAGFKNVDVTLGTSLFLTQHWSIDLAGGVGLLLDDVAESPVTQSRWQPFAVSTVNYSF